MNEQDRTQVDAGNARSEEQAKELKRIAESGKCPFCSQHYLEHEHGKPILKRGEHWLVTENRWPYKGALHQILFIHNKHLTLPAELGTEDWAELLKFVNEITAERGILGGTFMMRYGDSRFTGGTVTHLHAQLVSGSGQKGEEVITRVG